MIKIFIPVLLAMFVLSCSHNNKGRETASVTERPPQFILMAFDGSYSHSMWRETIDFGRENNARFTYFISGVYFVSEKDRKVYVEPSKGAGKSAIGFGDNEKDISIRARFVKEAINAGHEMASHANGHYDGGKYSYNQWLSELNQFDSILLDAPTRYNILNVRGEAFWPQYFNNNMVGFRAPLLAHNSSMFQVLSNKGYVYDTSRIDKMGYWPQKINGIWNFPLAGVRQARSNKKTISMDYNFYYTDSKGKKAPASQWQYFEDQMYETYINYFNNNYKGNRAPIDIGHHFSRWNGGAYWKALQRFAKSVCNLPEVRCVTYSELVDYLESGKVDLAALEQGNFKRMDVAGLNLPLVPQRAGIDRGELSNGELDELRNSLRSIPMQDMHEDIDPNEPIEL